MTVTLAIVPLSFILTAPGFPVAGVDESLGAVFAGATTADLNVRGARGSLPEERRMWAGFEGLVGLGGRKGDLVVVEHDETVTYEEEEEEE